VKKFPSKL